MIHLPAINAKQHRKKDKHILTLQISEGQWPEHTGVQIVGKSVFLHRLTGPEIIGTCLPGATLAGLNNTEIIIHQPVG